MGEGQRWLSGRNAARREKPKSNKPPRRPRGRTRFPDETRVEDRDCYEIISSLTALRIGVESSRSQLRTPASRV